MKCPVEPASLTWRDDSTPVSQKFDDVYFSTDNGLEESRYVFLTQNELPERLTALARKNNPRLVIGETGFGTGLNFLAAWQLRDQLAPDCQLHFVSVEKFPLASGDLKQALSHWPELERYATQLSSHYPPHTPGWHRVSFCSANVELSLFLGDAQDAFDSTDASIDAWFLDGFAPAKNPGMWTQALAHSIARLSQPGTTLSTFTAAALVREHFSHSGFKLERQPGFGRKRHMLCGTFAGPATSTKVDATAHSFKPWFVHQPQTPAPTAVAVIGAGLAGTAVAHSLARRNRDVTVIDSANHVAAGASGNPQGILYAKLSAEPSLRSAFYSAGYLYSLQTLKQLCKAGPEGDWHATGVLQLACNQTEQNRQRNFLGNNPQPQALVRAVDAEEASALAGVPLKSGGLFFPEAGWVVPRALCKKQLRHPRIQLKTGQLVDSMHYEAGQWHLLDSHGKTIAVAAIVVMANANDTVRFPQCANFPLKSIRGQVTSVPAMKGAELKTVICGDSYVAPAINGRFHLGATYNLDDATTECRSADDQENLRQVTALDPALGIALGFSSVSGVSELENTELQGRVGFRSATPDYMPLIGPVPQYEQFLNLYASLRKDASKPIAAPGEFHPGLYTSVGHGSKGLTSCPLAGEILASYICNEPTPVSRNMLEAVHPARFIIRDLIRNRIQAT